MSEERQITAYLEFPSGSSFQFTNKIAKKTEEKIYELDGIKEIASKIDSDRALFILKVKDYVIVDDSYIDYLKSAIGNTDPAHLFFANDNVKTNAREITLDFLGPDLDELRQITESAADRIRGMDNVTEVILRFKPPREELLLYVTGLKTVYGELNLLEVGDFLRLAIQGGIATKFIYENKEMDVRVRFAEQYRKSKDSLSEIRLKNKSGEYIPISEIATRKESKIPVKIYHKNKKRVYSITVKFQNVSRTRIDLVISEILKFPLPENYRIEVGKKAGSDEKSEEEFYIYSLLLIPLFGLAVVSGYYESLRKGLIQFVLSTIFLCLKITLVHWIFLKLNYPIFLSLFSGSMIEVFLMVVIWRKGGIRFPSGNLQAKMRRKRNYYFFRPVLGVVPFFLPFLFLTSGNALFVFYFMFLIWLSFLFSASLFPFFAQEKVSNIAIKPLKKMNLQFERLIFRRKKQKKLHFFLDTGSFGI